MIAVSKAPHESIDTLISRFKRKITNSGLLKELHKRQYYIKKSITKRNKKNASIKRHKLKKEYNDLQ